jgi:hypothetical protein
MLLQWLSQSSALKFLKISIRRLLGWSFISRAHCEMVLPSGLGILATSENSSFSELWVLYLCAKKKLEEKPARAREDVGLSCYYH